MAKTGKAGQSIRLIVFLLIAVAYGIRLFPKLGAELDTFRLITGLLRSAIYIGLFAAWGVSVRRRMVQPRIGRYLGAISALLVFWLLVRTAKYSIFQAPLFLRYLWYSYYIPQMLIPLMLVFVACSLGQPENFRLPKWTNALYVISGILLGLILTNDIHQLAFGFPNGLTHIDNGEYTHKIVYFLAIGWIMSCILTMFVMFYRKCRVPGSKKRIWRPCIPVFVLVIYWAMYLFAYPVLKLCHIDDFTIVSSLLCIAMLESCIKCGLIRSNKGYRELFRRSGIAAVLTDNDYNIVLSSNGTPRLSAEIMRQTGQAPVLLDGNLRLSGAAVKGGHVLWTEDVSELAGLLDELAERKEDLKEETALLRENYNTELRIRQLSEKNRLYDEIHRQAAPQIALLEALIEQLEASNDEGEKKRLLQKMVVIGVYLKRRSNLIFISEQSKTVPAKELALCFDETIENLQLSCVSCGCYFALSRELDSRTATALYDFAEQIIEAAFDTLRCLLIRLFESADSLAVSMELSCDAELSGFLSEQVSLTHGEDSSVCLVLRIPKGGAKE